MFDKLLFAVYIIIGFQILIGLFAILLFPDVKKYIFYVIYLMFLILSFAYLDLTNNYQEIFNRNKFIWEYVEGNIILLSIIFYVFFWIHIIPYKKFTPKIFHLLTRYRSITFFILSGFFIVFLNSNKKLEEFYLVIIIVSLYIICFGGLLKMIRVLKFEQLFYLIGSTILTISSLYALYYGFVVETFIETHSELSFLAIGSIIDTFFLSCGLVFNAFENGKRKVLLEYEVLDLKRLDLENKNLILENELALFHARITPHFLQNTFDMVGNKINLGDVEASLTVIRTVSAYLRQIFNNVGKSVITLEDEINFTESYLKMQQIIHDNLFTYRIEIDENADTYNILVPTMILQPIVENCIKHGFKDKISNGIIYLKVTENNNYCSILVQDNGIGLMENDSNTKPSGMKLTKERLNKMFHNGNPQNIIIAMQNRNDGITGTEFYFKFLIQ